MGRAGTDVLKPIKYVVIVWVFVILLNRVLFYNLGVFRQHIPELYTIIARGEYTFILGILGSIAAWIYGNRPKQVNETLSPKMVNVTNHKRVFNESTINETNLYGESVTNQLGVISETVTEQSDENAAISQENTVTEHISTQIDGSVYKDHSNEKEKIELGNTPNYYPKLSVEDVKELERTGADYYQSKKRVRKPEKLDDLNKQQAWKLFAESYKEIVLGEKINQKKDSEKKHK